MQNKTMFQSAQIEMVVIVWGERWENVTNTRCPIIDTYAKIDMKN